MTTDPEPNEQAAGSATPRSKAQATGILARIRGWGIFAKIGAVLGAIVLLGSAYGAVTGPGKEIWEHFFPPAQSAFDVTPNLGLTFVQNGQSARMQYLAESGPSARDVEVFLKSAAFEIEFPKPPDDEGYGICAWITDDVFTTPAGASAVDDPCFQPGTGMAQTTYSDGSLILSLDAFNYMIGERVRSVSDSAVRAYFASVLVGARTSAEKTVALSSWHKPLYLEITMLHGSDSTVERVKLTF